VGQGNSAGYAKAVTPRYHEDRQRESRLCRRAKSRATASVARPPGPESTAHPRFSRLRMGQGIGQLSEDGSWHGKRQPVSSRGTVCRCRLFYPRAHPARWSKILLRIALANDFRLLRRRPFEGLDEDFRLPASGHRLRRCIGRQKVKPVGFVMAEKCFDMAMFYVGWQNDRPFTFAARPGSFETQRDDGRILSRTVVPRRSTVNDWVR